MHFSGLKPAFAAAGLGLALILASSQSLRAGEESESAYSSFGAGMTLGQAMANESPVRRAGVGSDVGADNPLDAAALSGTADGTVGNGGQPDGSAVPARSLANFFADALWRKKAVRTLYRHTQAD